MDPTLRVPLDPAALRTAVGSVWRRVDVVESTGSTNADLVRRVGADEDVDGAVLIAENQTAGRGRLGRQWNAAPYAQLTVSAGVGARDVPVERWGWLPLAAGIAVVDAVAAITGVRADLKWPNDVMAGGRKLAGILAEAVPSKNVIIVGVGLNVTMTAEESRVPTATSLMELGARELDRQKLAARLMMELARRTENWWAFGGLSEQLLLDYRASSSTIGRSVRATLPSGQTILGTARDIDDEGRLCISADDALIAISAGDVVTLRPTDCNKTT